MNKWYRSRIVKAILILLANISVFTLAICVWWAASYHQIFMDVLEGAGNKTYEESSEFYGDFYIESMDVSISMPALNFYFIDLSFYSFMLVYMI